MNDRHGERPSYNSNRRDNRHRSRSPQNDRDRERKGNDRAYSSRNRDEKKKSSNTSSRNLDREKEVQRGIESAKNRLKSSLNAAISSGLSTTTRESTSSDAYPRRITNEYSSSDIVDSVARQEAIERIEEPGFAPASFKSDADSARAKKSFNKGKKTGGKDEDVAVHERAMFGPMWARKEIEKQQTATAQQRKNTAKTTSSSSVLQSIPFPVEPKLETSNRYPLAHESLSEDPKIRQERWLNIWRERRKMALEGGGGGTMV